MKTTPAAIRIQKLSDSIRGNAILRLPIISGTSQLPNGPSMPEVSIPIIIAPCSPTSVRYWLAPNTCTLGCSSSVRIIIALMPAIRKKNADADDVLDRDDLVVGAQAEVAADPLALGLVLGERRRVAEHPADRVVGEAEPDEEADHAEQVAEQHRDVVLPGLGAEVADAGAWIASRSGRRSAIRPPPARSRSTG